MSDHEIDPTSEPVHQPPSDITTTSAAANNEPTNQNNQAPVNVTTSSATAVVTDINYVDAPATIDQAPDDTFASSVTISLYCGVQRVVYAPSDSSEPGKDVTAYFTKALADDQQLFHGGAEKIFEDYYPGKPKEIRVWYNRSEMTDGKKDVFTLGRKPKSLFMCLVTVNPFYEIRENAEKDEKGNIVQIKSPQMPQDLRGYEGNDDHPGTNFVDDDFLKTKTLLGGGSRAPNNFQKLIEMLLRIKKRGLTVLPPDCLEQCSEAPEWEPWNFFAGYKLVESKFFQSPDGDELYFKIHSDRKVLLDFAERQSLTLRTNPFSFGGGGGMIYTHRLDEELRQSVLGFMKHFGDTIPEDDEFCKGKRNEETGQYEAWGFCVEVPQKMRLVLRMLREGWVFGGCGLQLDEMKENGTFLINYFPVHNIKYQEAYGVDRWGAFTTIFNPFNALADHELALIHYFGENIAIYFSWLRQYVLYLSFPLLIGFVAGVMQEAEAVRHIIGAAFAILMIIWGVAWIRKWQRAERRFSLRWGQDVEAQQELVRDEFEYDRKKLVDVRTIYTLDFEYPLTMQRLPDGTMVELEFPSLRRSLRRYLISYPLLFVLVCAMVCALFFVEWYRQKEENLGSSRVQIGASIVSSLTTIIFSKVAAVLIDLLNDFENCRTDQEYEEELVMKSFAFNFISTYFSVITIGIWPGVPNSERINQLRAQMVTQQVAMPFVGNFIELVVPKIVTNLQKRADTLGGYCAALCSYLCCCCSCACCNACNYSERKIPLPKNDRVAQGIELWKQAQKGRYTTTSTDYLEVTIQYGYMMMFASAFPWAGVAAFFNNMIEIRVDAYKLLNEFQRPVARTTTTIGAWNEIFWILTGLAIVTNSYYITVISPTPKEVKMKDSMDKLLEYFSFLQYFLVIAILILGVVRGMVSPSVKKAAVKASLLNDRAIQEYVKKQLAMSPQELAESRAKAQHSIDATEVEESCCPAGCCC